MKAEPVDVDAARVAIFALDASLPDSMSQRGRDSVDVNGLALTRNEAAEELANLPKPLHCTANHRQERFVIECVPISEPGLVTAHARRAGQMEEFWLSRLKGFQSPPLADQRILFRSRADSLVSTVAALRTFLRDYHVLYTMSTLPVDRSPETVGVIATIAMGPPAAVDLR